MSGINPWDDTPTSLTEFGPLSSDVKPSGNFLTRLWKRKKDESDSSSISSQTSDSNIPSREASVDRYSSRESTPVRSGDTDAENNQVNYNEDEDSSVPVQLSLSVSTSQESTESVNLPKRTLTGVLNRLGNILDRRSSTPCAYKDSDFKQYWMPDSSCKVCYDCGDKFTTIRRRHHCRICGQIFCSKCCNQELPGKIIGYKGGIRVCIYCSKVVQRYAQQAGTGSELKVSNEDLTSISPMELDCGSCQDTGVWGTWRKLPDLSEQRRFSVTSPTSIPFDLTPQSDYTNIDNINQQMKILTQDSIQLKALWKRIFNPNTGIEWQSHRIRLKTYQNCILGKDMVDWMIKNDKVLRREQAVGIGQALIDAGYIECIGQVNRFSDDFTVYQPGEAANIHDMNTKSEEIPRVGNSDDSFDPPWMREIESNVDDEHLVGLSVDDTLKSQSEQDGKDIIDSGMDKDFYRRGSFKVETKVKTDNESLGRQDSTSNSMSEEFFTGTLFVNRSGTTVADIFNFPPGWRNIEQTREENHERLAFERLSKSFSEHQLAIVKQLLSQEGLPLHWDSIIMTTVKNISHFVKPDIRNDGDDMDIREYIHIKKIPVGKREQTSLIHGVVFTKNVAHKKMPAALTNPKILLLRCAIEYQRVENKFSSLEPQILQEKEYLRNCVARIATLKPNVVLVEKTVSRLAQEYLLDAGITLIFNVKSSVMDRVSRSTQAHIVHSIDSLVNRPTLGFCHTFKMTSFVLPNGDTKTMTLFEGCATHLGCTVTLRGGTIGELRKVKKILRFMSYVAYHSQLQLSFCIDEFALPPPDPEEQQTQLNELDVSCEVLPKEGLTSAKILTSSPGRSPVTVQDRSPRLSPCTVKGKSAENSPSNIRKDTSVIRSDPDTCLIATGNTACEVTAERELQPNKDLKIRIELCDSENDQTEISALSLPTIPSTSDDPNRTPCNEKMKNSSKFIYPNEKTPVSKETNDEIFSFPCDLYDDDLSYETTEVDSLNGESGKNSLHSDEKERSRQPSGCSEIKELTDHSDPLHHYQKNKDDSIFHSSVVLEEEKLTRWRYFRKILDETLLSVCPFLKSDVPYLETEMGNTCFSRQYLPDELYWSPALSKDPLVKSKCKYLDLDLCSNKPGMKSNIKITEAHPLILSQLITPINGRDVKALVADFRARGGRIKVMYGINNAKNKQIKQSMETDSSKASKDTSNSGNFKFDKKVDCLDPSAHQRLSVLFSSYSFISPNHPNPCVNPWVVTMDFYGKNDITLGGFLERFCFRESYACPSITCDIPMVNHIRRFVHGQGCIYVMLRKLENSIPGANANIVMWSWCRKCKQVTPVQPLSCDSWNMSFAKYLELRYYGDIYKNRGFNDACPHSLHHDFYQYFGLRDVVASFKYGTVSLKEIHLPDPLVFIEEPSFGNQNFMEITRRLSNKGTEVYSIIFEHMVKLKKDAVGENQRKIIEDYMDKQQGEKARFRQLVQGTQQKICKIEEYKLTESPDCDCYDVTEISDNVIKLKRLIVECVVSWNTKIQEFLNYQKKIKPPQASSKKDKEKDSLSSSKDDLDGLSHSPKPLSNIDDGHSAKFSISDAGSSSEDQDTDSLTAADKVPAVPPTRKSVESLEKTQADPVPIFPSSRKATESADKVLGTFESSASLDSYTYGITPAPPVDSQDSSAVPIEPVPEQGKQEVPYTAKDDTKDVPPPASSALSRFISGSTDDLDGKQEKKTTSLKKNIISTFLSGSGFIPIQIPFDPCEHYLLPSHEKGEKVPVVIYDTEPSSVIAYALSCDDYNVKLNQIQTLVGQYQKECQLQSKVPKSSDFTGKMESLKPNYEGGKRGSTGVLSFFRGSSSKEPSPVLIRRNDFSASVKYTAHCDSDNVSTDGSFDEPEGFSVLGGDSDKAKFGKQPINHHIEIQFADYDNMAKYYCRVYFAEQFRKLRRLIFPAGEEAFIRSLCRCKHWEAKGGKSGSAFCKTDDDRFVLKQMSRMEVDSFEEFAPNYFHYITNAHLNQKPTALAKILGVYRIGFRNANTNMNLKQDLLVMENLFYQKKITQKFDLKGSRRNRLVNTSGKKEEDLVLLDENLLKYSVDTPLYIRPHSKTVLTMAIDSDSDFLSTNLVMDYSLLVGVDEKRKELVIGIIDYIRTFTWDKKLEMVFKSATAQGKMPTVVSPELYRRRFLEAMEKYFLGVPDQWTGLGCQVDIGQQRLQTS